MNTNTKISLRVYRANMSGQVRQIRVLLSKVPIANVHEELREQFAANHAKVYQTELRSLLRTLELM